MSPASRAWGEGEDRAPVSGDRGRGPQDALVGPASPPPTLASGHPAAHGGDMDSPWVFGGNGCLTRDARGEVPATVASQSWAPLGLELLHRPRCHYKEASWLTTGPRRKRDKSEINRANLGEQMCLGHQPFPGSPTLWGPRGLRSSWVCPAGRQAPKPWAAAGNRGLGGGKLDVPQLSGFDFFPVKKAIVSK